MSDQCLIYLLAHCIAWGDGSDSALEQVIREHRPGELSDDDIAAYISAARKVDDAVFLAA